MNKKIQKKILIAPSILSADFTRLGADIASVEKAGCDWIHVDVMDGHFVPNITIGPVVVKDVRKQTNLPLDVHLMIDDPGFYIEPFAKAGADYITIHYEACRNKIALLKKMKAHGVKAGISLKPKTRITAALLKVISQFDLVLIMTVEPGFGGQSFMHDMIPKIKQIRKSYKGILSVDGGINNETAALAKDAGVDVLVAGSFVFSKKDRKKAIAGLR